MKNILIIGAGKSSSALIKYLLDTSEDEKLSLTIGDIWASIHVNSLIGVQKILESSVIQSKLEISLWYTICYPILELPILLILALLFLMIFTFINIKY